MTRKSVLLTVGLALTLAACSGDKGPGPVAGPSDFTAYVGVGYWTLGPPTTYEDKIYIMDGASKAVTDSIPVASMPLEMAVSPEGRWLFVKTVTRGLVGTDSLTKFDTQTLESVWSIPSESGSLTMLKNGDLLLHGHNLIRSSDGSLVRRIDEATRLYSGPGSGTTVASVSRDTTVHVWRHGDVIDILDVETGEIRGSYVPSLSTYDVLEVEDATLDPTEGCILVVGRSLSSRWFVIGDVESGRTIVQQPLNLTAWEIAVSHDGRTVVLSDDLDPHTPIVEPPPMPPASLDLFDLEHYSRIGRITYDAGLWTGSVKQVRFLAGDMNLICASSLGGGGPLQFVNLETRMVEEKIWLSPSGSSPVSHQVIGPLAITP